MSATHTSTSGRTVAHEYIGVATAMVSNPGGDIAFQADDAANHTTISLTPDVAGDATAAGGLGGTHAVEATGGGSVTVFVHAPTGSILSAHSQGGSICQFGTAATVTADTSGGDLRVQHVTDELELHTAGGDVRIGSTDCRAIAATSGGDVHASNLLRGGSLHTAGGDVRAHLSGNNPLTVRTSGGDIDLSTADGVSENYLSWRTSGGDVEVNGRDRSCQSR